jgi:hypothetical protein
MSAESEFVADLRATSIRTAVEHLRAIHELKQGPGGVPRAVSAASSPAQSQPAPKGVDFVFDAARVHVTAVNEMLKLNGKYRDEFISGLRTLLQMNVGTASRPAAASQPAPARSYGRTMCTIAGVPGDDRTLSFPVESSLPTGTDFKLSVAEFHSTTGGAPFAPKVTFRPDPASLARNKPYYLSPAEKRTLQMTVTLDPPFESGQSYVGEVYVVSGGQDARILQVLEVQVEVQPADQHVRGAPIRRKKSGKPKKSVKRKQ